MGGGDDAARPRRSGRRRRSVRTSGLAGRAAASPAWVAGCRRLRRGTGCRGGPARTAPCRCAAAPVNDPFSWPNSSLSSRVSGSAAQLMATNLPGRRLAEASWMARAICSLPVPVSPRISTVELVSATWLISSNTSCIRGLLLMHVAERVPAADSCRRAATSSMQRPLAQRALDEQAQVLRVGRLGEEVVGPQAHGLDRLVHAPVPGGHDDRDRQRCGPGCPRSASSRSSSASAGR